MKVVPEEISIMITESPNSPKENKHLYIVTVFNALLGITDRVLQFLHNFKEINNENVSAKFKVFCFIPTMINVFMYLLYIIIHHEKMLTLHKKIIGFIKFVIGSEILYPVGVYQSLLTKYSYYSDNPILILRLINAMHCMFVSMPQCIIVPINGKIRESLSPLSISSLLFSVIFIFWSLFHYLFCVRNKVYFQDCINYYSFPSEEEEKNKQN